MSPRSWRTSAGVNETLPRGIEFRSCRRIEKGEPKLSRECAAADFLVFLPRERGHEYRVDHHGDHFYVVTNAGAENFRLMRTPIDAPGPADGARD